MHLGTTGVWWSSSFTSEDAAELEQLGYGTFWISGGFEPGLAPHFAQLLSATQSMVVASGIVSIWASEPDDIAASVAALGAEYSDRFLLGLGVSHSVLVPGYEKPYARMVDYLDALDAAEQPVGPDRRVIGALGPQMLRLAASRTAGAHPYLVPLEHTAFAREVLGGDRLLAPEVTVVLERDADKAREIARQFVRRYMVAENYTNNLRSFGFDADDFADGGSDRLIDALVAWGDPEAIATRIQEHRDAGADHVCIQVLTEDESSLPIAVYRELAPALHA